MNHTKTAGRTGKAEQLKELEQQMDKNQTAQNNVQEWTSLVRQCSRIETLDRETLLRLIDNDKIESGEQHIVEGVKEREIRIHYKFVGYIG